MSTTLATVRSRIRYRIGEAVAAFWSEPEITSYINDAKDDLQNAILTINKDFFQKSATLVASTTTNRILLPADFSRLKSIRMLTAGLERVIFTPEDRNTPDFQAALLNSGSANNPSQFMYDIYNCIDVPAEGQTDWRGWNLALSPRPNAAHSIALEYVAQLPDLVNESDSFSFLDQFIGYVKDKATYYALSKGPSGDYQNYGSQAEMKLNRILAVASKSNMQGAEFVEDF